MSKSCSQSLKLYQFVCMLSFQIIFCQRNSLYRLTYHGKEVREAKDMYMRNNLNLSKPKTSLCTTSFNIQKLCSAHNAFMCFAWISEQRAIISLYRINLSVFITEAESVCCAVRTGSLTH